MGKILRKVDKLLLQQRNINFDKRMSGGIATVTLRIKGSETKVSVHSSHHIPPGITSGGSFFKGTSVIGRGYDQQTKLLFSIISVEHYPVGVAGPLDLVLAQS